MASEFTTVFPAGVETGLALTQEIGLCSLTILETINIFYALQPEDSFLILAAAIIDTARMNAVNASMTIIECLLWSFGQPYLGGGFHVKNHVDYLDRLK
ncbi:hypothetical protein Dform_00610 [Dehalogenimonas formicexedens]|uniref:Uncharacterized protein n=2 Tax=Dehalogenimonas formicexedens TaxID=1839801 RepID=A0A1P8F6B0_9CHLR|nr:hypothetical protein Dform_00610 [Dehalogenimonas formicexedens]